MIQIVNTRRYLKHPQHQVEEASRKYLIISTHKGYFQYNRLPFGIVNAPALFCRYIENLLNGIDNVAVYFDDIAITGPTNKIKVYEDCYNRKLDDMELTEGLLRKETSADHILDHILKNIKQFVQMHSWNSKITKEIQPFYDKRNEISLENVVTNNGVERRRHADHIRERNDDLPLIDEPVVIDTSELLSTEVPNENQEKIEITTPQNLEPEINDFNIVSVPGTTTKFGTRNK
ncbi:Reverse transcriptase (RNA-dependent DNA polymerase) [Popillia japonica]|uniref:Reverse transcriptase (RNA-dependent DNA polymerase) n=1 Tax=Popillia japonica TaxID=7064 RepID=A0AAW1JY65_POPJA